MRGIKTERRPRQQLIVSAQKKGDWAQKESFGSARFLIGLVLSIQAIVIIRAAGVICGDAGVLPFFIDPKTAVESADLIGARPLEHVQGIGVVEFSELESNAHLVLVAMFFRGMRKNRQKGHERIILFLYRLFWLCRLGLGRVVRSSFVWGR